MLRFHRAGKWTNSEHATRSCASENDIRDLCRGERYQFISLLRGPQVRNYTPHWQAERQEVTLKGETGTAVGRFTFQPSVSIGPWLVCLNMELTKRQQSVLVVFNRIGQKNGGT